MEKHLHTKPIPTSQENIFNIVALIGAILSKNSSGRRFRIWRPFLSQQRFFKPTIFLGTVTYTDRECW